MHSSQAEVITGPAVLREINHRNDLPFFLNRHGLTGDAVELGTYQGDFAEIMLLTWTGRRLNLIDPYRQFGLDEYLDGTAVDPVNGNVTDFEAVFWKAHERLNRFPTSYFIRRTSAEAVDMFGEDSLDLVYVDANHEFNHATQDIQLWWPKVKPGGIMGLHDCYLRNDSMMSCGVFDAVMDHAERIGQRPRVTCCTTAWFVKP